MEATRLYYDKSLKRLSNAYHEQSEFWAEQAALWDEQERLWRETKEYCHRKALEIQVIRWGMQ